MKKSMIYNIYNVVLWGMTLGLTACGQHVEGKGQALLAQPIVMADAMEIPMGGNDTRILNRSGYTLSYNDRMKIPNWVAWELTAEEVAGRVKRADEFIVDTELPVNARSEDRDYRDPRYDRGHMAPAGDMKWSRKAMEESFLLSNMCPQASHLNRGCWRILEESCRKWAQQYGNIYIICGPIVSKENTPLKIGKNKVTVPDSFFKVVLYKKNGYHAVGFVFPNDDCHRPVRDYAVSVDEVERMTGLDFFHQLPDDVETEVESTLDLSRLKINSK